MYHPSRGGVRGGRDQFKWDDVKVDKHRENYLGHSIKAPVGRWQKGKDLHWYSRDKKSQMSDAEAAKEEIRRIKEEEEQAMREALGLAPKRSSRPQGNRLDKHEYSELVKRGSTAEDLGAGHAEAAQVQGLGLYKVSYNQEESSSLPEELKEIESEREDKALHPRSPRAGSAEVVLEEDKRMKKKRRHEEGKDEKMSKRERHEERKDEKLSKRERRENKRSCDDRRTHRREEKRRQ